MTGSVKGFQSTMRLRHIEVFNAVMLTGSVTAASRMINVTQPAVSRTLKHAELQLGFALFHRVGGRLQPTVEAQALYPLVERLFTQLDEVQRMATSLRQGHGQNTLRVLTTLALSYEVMPRAMRFFQQKHPGVVVHHQSMHSPQIVEALVLQEADLGFVLSGLTHPSLEQEPMGERRVMCVAPKGLFSAAELAAGHMQLSRLGGRPVVAMDARDPLSMTLGQALRDQDIELNVAMTVQTYHAALAMAQHGVGIALVEGCTAASADRDRVDVLPVEPRIPIAIHALRPQGHANALMATYFTRCFKRALAELD